MNVLNTVYTLRFFSSKCRLFHNSNVFGSCIIHILYTGCGKIKKNNSSAKRLRSALTGNNEARSCNHCCSGKGIIVTYCECVMSCAIPVVRLNYMVRRIQSKNTTIKQTRQAYAHAHIAKPWRQTTKPPPPPPLISSEE